MSFVFSDLGRMPSAADCGVFATPKYLVECACDALPPHLDLLLVFVYDHACNHLYTEGIRGATPCGVQGNILYFYDGLPFDLESRQRIIAPPFQEPIDIVLPKAWQWVGRCNAGYARAFGSCMLVQYEASICVNRDKKDSNYFVRLYSESGDIVKEWPGTLDASWVEGNTLLLWMGTMEPFEGDDLESEHYMPRSYTRLYKVERV